MFEIDGTTATIGAALGGLAIAVTTAFSKLVWWLSDQFKNNRDFVRDWLQSHEDKDQKRHEDNIVRFTQIETKIDTVITNGNSVHN